MVTFKSDKQKRVFLLLRLAVLAISVFILLKIVDIRTVFEYLRAIPYYLLAILVSINIFRAWLTGLRWQMLNPDVSGQLNRWHYFRFVMIAYTFNLIMPGALGGDFVKTALAVTTVKDKKIDNMIAILADRFIGLLSILFLGTAALIFASELPGRSSFYTLYAFVYLAVIVLVFLVTQSYLDNMLKGIFLRLGSIGAKLIKGMEVWRSALQYFAVNKRKVVFSLLLCLPIHLIAFLTAYILVQALNIELSFFNVSLIFALNWIVTAIPITISGAGVRELSMVYLFSLHGIGAEPATALSIYVFIITLLLGFIGAFFIIDWKKGFYSIIIRLKGGKHENM